MSPPPEEVIYTLEVRRLDAPGKPPTIRPEKTQQVPLYTSPRVPAPYGGESFAFNAPAEQSPERTAFLYLRDFYLWFNIPEDLIPYTKEEDGTRRVNTDELR
jgi:hypothetical protein